LAVRAFVDRELPELWLTAAPHKLQGLHNELDLSNAARPQLDVVRHVATRNFSGN